MAGRLPAIVPRVVTFPFDEILVLIAVGSAIEELFNFIFQFIVNDHGFWWWVGVFGPAVLPRRETIHMENRMLVHRGWEAEAVGELTSAFEDLIGAELPRG
jgi:hypothetical protein